MTGSAVRSRMTQRCIVQRNTVQSKDPFGHTAAPATWETHIDELPCFFYSRNKVEIVDGQKEAVVESIGLFVPRGTDINEGDRIVSIRDRRATLIVDAVMEVLTTQEKHTHLEVVLRKID